MGSYNIIKKFTIRILRNCEKTKPLLSQKHNNCILEELVEGLNINASEATS